MFDERHNSNYKDIRIEIKRGEGIADLKNCNKQ